ncbi:hypothetical protein BT96DRAFT_998643 [Gymnopus androsaceus JB14]|uniref:F-box domain-containing protein n=1 Tax=Gymnopus androsaceus JB14 TaxID=1447944 RepID=A0A6A4H916_9AGAR|nr:hypothetical protein BT96DRAFT_998643 [Gymnopus androsaceus JB14]
MFMDIAVGSGSILQTFFGAPNLCHLVISGYGGMTVLTRLALPTEQLTSFRLHNPGPLYSYAEFMGQCVNLVSLEVFVADETHMTGFTPDTLIFLSNLKSLHVPCVDLAHPFDASLLSCLKTPLLKDLTLHWVCCQSAYGFCCIFRDVIGLQSHSGNTNLCSLTLDGIDAGRHSPVDFVDDLKAIFAIFPTIRSFQIRRCELGKTVDPLLRALTFIPGHNVLLPKLADFELVKDMKKSFILKLMPMILSRMILSRWWSKETNSQTGIEQSLNHNGLVAESDSRGDSIQGGHPYYIHIGTAWISCGFQVALVSTNV